MSTIEMFPEEAVALHIEIQNHPRLQMMLSTLDQETASLQEKFAVILFYCGMLVDGYYDNEATEKLFAVCLEKLKSMRAISVQ